MASGGGAGREAPPLGRRGGPVSASCAADARCAVSASQTITGNDTPGAGKGRLAGACVVRFGIRVVPDAARTCIRRVRGRRKDGLYSRPFGREGAACLSEVDVRVGAIVLVIWLIIGVIAAGQRGYYGSSSESCAHAGTIVATVAAGPLNYVGVNPKVSCHMPSPSS